MATPLYTTDILRLATGTVAWPRLERPALTIEKRAPLCGSRLTLDLDMTADGRIAAIGMAVEACAIGQASATIFASHAIGQDASKIATAYRAFQAWLDGSSAIAPDWPDIDRIAVARAYSARHGAMLLPFSAAHSAFCAEPAGDA